MGQNPLFQDGDLIYDGIIFREIPEMERFFEIVGFNGVTSAIGFVRLKDWSERNRTTQEVAASLFPRFMGITGVMAFPITPPPLGQGGFGQPVSFVVQSTGTGSCRDVTGVLTFLSVGLHGAFFVFDLLGVRAVGTLESGGHGNGVAVGIDQSGEVQEDLGSARHPPRTFY